MDEEHRTGDVGIDDVANLGEILIEKSPTQPVARIGQQGGNRTTLQRRVKFVHAFQRRQVRLYRFGRGAELTKLRDAVANRRLVGSNEQIVPFLGAELGQLVADARGCAGHHGQRTGSLSHDGSSC